MYALGVGCDADIMQNLLDVVLSFVFTVIIAYSVLFSPLIFIVKNVDELIHNQ